MLIALGCIAGFVLVAARSTARAEPVDPEFSHFVAGLWPKAQKAGVTRATFERAFTGMTPDPTVIAKTQRQAEFVKPVWDYLASAVSRNRIERGTARAKEFDATLAKVERAYGVDRYAVLGVWGMETNFGGFTGDNFVVRALATLAFEHYRGDYFRKELISALRILQEGHVKQADFKGSWAGAMGQTQFMPSSFHHYAVDFDGDGRKDIWNDVPDALASTANYLAKHHWLRNTTWGYEVIGAAALHAPARGLGAWKPFAAWARAGVRRADGEPMPTIGEAAALAPAGDRGPVFLVTRNFKVIKSYNNSDSYALGVALLSDGLAGQGPLRAPWPVSEAAR